MNNQFNSQNTPALNTASSRNAASPIQKPVFISLLMDHVSTRAIGKGDVTVSLREWQLFERAR